MSAFPNLGDTRIDSSQYEVEIEDVSMSSKSEGGYEFTRKRHTRRPRRTWKVGYQVLKSAEKQAIQDHWDAMGGGSLIFSWLNHQDGQTYQVRFKPGSSLTFKYVGKGDNQLWNCSFVVVEA